MTNQRQQQHLHQVHQHHLIDNYHKLYTHAQPCSPRRAPAPQLPLRLPSHVPLLSRPSLLTQQHLVYQHQERAISLKPRHQLAHQLLPHPLSQEYQAHQPDSSRIHIPRHITRLSVTADHHRNSLALRQCHLQALKARAQTRRMSDSSLAQALLLHP